MPKPHTLTLRAYGVGFGDCFLLTFRYNDDTGDRHMLIDFGCTQKPPCNSNNTVGGFDRLLLSAQASR